MPATRDLLPDTDVVVDFLRGTSVAVELIQRERDRIHLSVVVIAEIYAGAQRGGLREIDRFLESFPSIPITPRIARAGGLLRTEYGPSHAVGLADALIAASAVEEGLELATLNVKHYPMFPGLKPAYSK